MITKESLKTFVASNPSLVKMKASEEYAGLSVLKYSQKVFFSDKWSIETLNLRGTVVDTDFNLIALPFRKVFSRHEVNKQFDRDEEVIAVRKVNGFMASVTYVPGLGQPLIATTGSVDSAFCDYARQLIPMECMFYITKQGFERASKGDPMITYVFEIVHPEDPHVVLEDIGCYLLGMRTVDYESMNLSANLHQNSEFQKYYDEVAVEMKVRRPEWKKARWSDIVKESESLDMKHEGYMCHSENLLNEVCTLKLKGLYYSLTKFFGRRSKDSWTNTPDAVPAGLANHKDTVLKLRDQLLTYHDVCIEDENGVLEKYNNFYDIPDEQLKFALIRSTLDEWSRNEQEACNQ